MESYQRLEVELAAWIEAGPEQMVVCSSGTAALQLALTALNIPPKSRCLAPECSFVACGRSVVAAGLEPVFVDCGDDLLMDDMLVDHAPAEVEAMMPVHIHGRRCAMNNLEPIAAHHAWKIIEDIAQLHGVRPHPSSDAACWSFNRSKIVHGEEGGACWFRDKAVARRARLLRNQGHDSDDPTWSHLAGGSNWRMTNANAVPILQSLRMFEENLKYRWESMERLRQLTPHQWRMPRPVSPWVYDLRLPMTTEGDKIVKTVMALREKGINARCCFRPLGDLPEFMGKIRVGGGIKAWQMFREVVALPLPMLETQEREATECIRQLIGV